MNRYPLGLASCWLCLVLALVLAIPSTAGPLRLVEDLNTRLSFSSDSNPSDFRRFGDRALFRASPNFSENNLWVSDGTAAGTFPLHSSSAEEGGYQQFLGVLGGRVLWMGEAGQGNQGQVWSSDGTPNGAQRLAPEALISRSFLDVLRGMIQHRGLFYFSADSPEGDGIRVWRTDGTPEGSFPLLPPEGRFSAGAPVALGGHVFFRFDRQVGQQGFELWRTDGSVAGTRRVVDRETADSVNAGSVADAGGRFVWLASRSTDGAEVLWSSDGTAGGTRIVRAFGGGAQPRSPRRVAVVSSRDGSSRDGSSRVGGRTLDQGGVVTLGDLAYFTARSGIGSLELWRTDGTTAGTVPITAFGETSPGAEVRFGSEIVSLGTKVVFVANLDFTGNRHWSTAGTPPSVQRLGPEEDPPLGFSESQFRVVGDQAFFVATRLEDPESDLWVTDGTSSGTRPFSQVCGCTGRFDAVQGLGDEVVVALSGSSQGGELWTSDGTSAGTSRLARLPEEVNGFGDAWLTRIADRYLFSLGALGYGEEPWQVVRGQQPGLLVDLSGFGTDADPENLVDLDGTLLFSADVGSGGDPLLAVEGASPSRTLGGFDPSSTSSAEGSLIRRGAHVFSFQDRDQLLVTDGSEAGTAVVWTAERSASVQVAAEEDPALAPDLVFALYSSTSGFELWRSDATTGGTQVLVERPDLNFFQVVGLTRIGDAFYFMAGGLREPGIKVWKSDGTAGGTVQLLSFGEDLGVSISDAQDPSFTSAGDEVLFFLGYRNGMGLWGTDGTVAGTRRLVEIVPDLSNGAETSSMVALGGSFYFLVNDRRGPILLWRTDGTAAGTGIVRNFGDGTLAFAGNSFELVRFAGGLYFPGGGIRWGRELWRTDGTAAGTVPVLEESGTSAWIWPLDLTVADEQLFFTATDPHHGRELWVSDGAAAGTRLVQDLKPGAEASNPRSLTVSGDHLYFSADDGLTGRELWALNRTDGENCQPSETHLCLNDGRFQVEARWRDFQDRQGLGRAEQLTADTGYFWFFNEENVEVVLKELDGRTTNGHFWTFYGALSNVEYSLTVTDTETGAARRYFNPLGNFASVGDTRSFGPAGAGALEGGPGLMEAALGSGEAVVTSSFDGLAIGGGCAPSSTRLCLQEDRFSVEARWTDFRGNTGAGQAVELTGDTGYFWFFRETNVEAILKVLDGRANNGNYWVFYGALSNVDYDLIVTDTTTGEVRTYQNRNRNFASVGDTAAFVVN